MTDLPRTSRHDFQGDRLLEQAHRGIDLLEAEESDPVGRGLLGEAIDRLTKDDGELPDWVAAARRKHLHPQPPALPLRTERLVLRPLTMGDLDDLLGYRSRAEVVRYMPTEPVTRAELVTQMHRWLDLDETGAPLPAGDEPPRRLQLVLQLDARVVGEVLLMMQPPAYSQIEIGWVMHPEVGGHGYATEAAKAALDIAFGHYRAHRVFADLDPRNGPSRALCERLGMRLETHALKDYWSKGEWTDSLRYGLLAEEHAEMGSTPGRVGTSIEG